jgi:hypothetical protein
MSFEKISVENINVPGHTENVRADKYQDMRVALLKIMPADAPGLPFSEIKEATKPHLSPDLFPEGRTSGWWAKCVQLDLEAKGLVARTKATPLTFYKT